MIDFLIKKLLKDNEKIMDSKVRERIGVISSIIGIILNIILFLIKYAMGLLSNSIAIMSDAFNNLSDSSSCIVTIIGYKMAAKPADKNHPFGHGRVEYLTSMAIAVIIILVGFDLLKSSINKIIKPEDIEFNWYVLVALLLSICVKLWMAYFNTLLGKKIKSSIMTATAKDSLSDVIATTATIISLFVSGMTDFAIDGYMGGLVSIFVLYSGYKIISETIDQLLGKPADEETVEAIKNIIMSSDVSLGIHEFILHTYGPGIKLGSIHVEVDSKGDLLEIHDKIDELERRIQNEMNIMITIHMDPLVTDDEFVLEYYNKLKKIVKEIDKNISIHDFRIVKGPTHTNFIFDLEKKYECTLTDKYIKEQIDLTLMSEDFDIFTVINFEKSFC